MARMKRILVERRWIASENREWGFTPVGGAWTRGGSLARALELAAVCVDSDVGALIQVMPDETSAQVKKAYEAAGWR